MNRATRIARAIQGYQTKLATLLALFVVAAAPFVPAITHAATTGYPASDVLGQLDGSGNPDFTTKALGTSATTMSYPTGTTLDTVHHRLFVNDEENRRILIYNLDASNTLLDHTPDYVLGQPGFNTSGYTVSQSSVNGYLGSAYDSIHDRLFVTDQARIMVFDLSNGITNGMNASYVLGQPDFTDTTDRTTQSGVSSLEDVTYDEAGQRLFVDDDGNNRVMVYDLSGGITNGMNASYVLGQPDFTTNTTTTTQNGFSRNESVVYNPATKQLFVGESGNQRVTVFDLSNGITNGMNASYVLGQPDFTTVNTRTTQNGFDQYIEGLGIDSARNILYVSDDNNNRILLFDLSNGITNGMNASMVLGEPDFTTTAYTASSGNPCWSGGSGYVPSQTNVCDIESSIAVDSVNNRVYFADSGNNRVLIYDLPKLAATSPTQAGTDYSHLLGTPPPGTNTYTVVAGALPDGLVLDASTGALSGTPTKPGTFTFSIKLVNSQGVLGAFTDVRSYTLTIPPSTPDTGFGLLVGHPLATAAGTLLAGLALTFIARNRKTSTGRR